MDLSAEVRPGVNRYVSGKNILTDLPQYLKPFKKVCVITGEISFNIFQEYYQAQLPYPVYHYDGSSSDEDAARLAAEIKQTEVIVAIGGGRLLDTAKLTAENLNCELISIPTLISNCAPFTPIAAVYHPDHTFKRMACFTRAAFLTLVDWQFLLATPVDYFIAGIGDTIAKWYEIEGVTRHLSEDAKTGFIRLGIASAKEILEILLKDAQEAVQDLKNQSASPAFGRIADTIVALAGTVGGFAAKFGRTAGAHAIHNGLSFLPETHELLHGAKVAYGVLVQLSYTEEFEQIEKLLPFYQLIGLPVNLADLNIPEFDQEKLMSTTEFAASKAESFNLIDKEVSSEKILIAMEKLEKLISQQ